jgi:hypothetical protein
VAFWNHPDTAPHKVKGVLDDKHHKRQQECSRERARKQPRKRIEKKENTIRTD